MTPSRKQRDCGSCVSVSTTGIHESQSENHLKKVGLNRAHEISMITSLVCDYGWNLGDDGNLYNPRPEALQLGRVCG